MKPIWPKKQDRVPPWRPATRPPSRAEALKRLLDNLNRQDEIVRRHMAEARAYCAKSAA